MSIAMFALGRNSSLLLPTSRQGPQAGLQLSTRQQKPLKLLVPKSRTFLDFDNEAPEHRSADSFSGAAAAAAGGGSLCRAPRPQTGAANECSWKFQRYLPSQLESTWWDHVDEYGYPGADVCRVAWEKFWPEFEIYVKTCNSQEEDLVVPDRSFRDCRCDPDAAAADDKGDDPRYDPRVFSRFEYVNSCTGAVHHTFIEPLAGALRHPLMCKFNSSWYHKFKQRKDWMVVDQWDLHANKHHGVELGGSGSYGSGSSYKTAGESQSKSRTNTQTQEERERPHYYYFDAGASVWEAGPGGASQSWFDGVYRGKCVEFDGYWLWEARPMSGKVLESVPAKVLPKYHWFNVPASTNQSSKFSPLFHIKAVAKPSDHVVVKIDIDNSMVEEAIINSILADETLQTLIDELFWEHHINMRPIARAWGNKHGLSYNVSVGQRVSIGIFRKLRQAGIRAHSWV
eukprot:CAMPEP_0178444090 /NCGR_PEP_ID=MMETSP0689_2-20121128/39290_1 /TAXON_ID=160604 /ORGANISM="Amphidinium massartii, Strain CS-259" /LENGTH=454 /DNA_ID=CAMNT_0020068235 /DNA_START=158 /DNA_END=1522 /DNA_ORIENTATION=-